MKRFTASNAPDLVEASVPPWATSHLTLTVNTWLWGSGQNRLSAQITAKQARRLAEWLNAAADELDARS